KIQGFRPGKAPKDMVKRMFFFDIRKSLLDSLIPKALGKELKDLGLNPISTPVIEDLKFEEGHPLFLRTSFEILPEFELPDYKRISVTKNEVSVTEEDVDRSLQELQQRAAEYVPIEGRGVVDGDYALVEIKGKDMKSNKLQPTEKVLILAGHPDNEKLLNENLKGLKVNEERQFVISYDANHQNHKLAGRRIEYNLKLISIKEKKLPPVNDDFAKVLGEYKDLADLKEMIKKEILASKDESSKREMAEHIIAKVSDKIDIELPETLVEEENISLLKQRLAQIPRQELNKDKIEALKNEGRKQAEKNLKNHLVLRKIAEKEGFDVSEDEEDQEIKAIAKANRVPLAQVIDNLNKEGRREELKNAILLKKTVDFLVKQAIIN
ncbi:MAG: trigger factor, partial [Candidatus Aminicenantes bacterium]|nr:trigger factor [Candidatus Aminicenantes bacterium]